MNKIKDIIRRIFSKELHSRPNLISIALILVLDRIVKFVSLYLAPVEFLPFMNFIFVKNEGMAFGMLGELGYANLLLSAITICALFFLMFLYSSYDVNEYMRMGILLMIAGAIGNLLDRFFYGYVIDMFDFFIGSWHFATFNVADAAISVGAVLVIVFMFVSEIREHYRKRKANSK